MLVEDSPTQALRGRFALEGAGFEVVVITTGPAVFDYVEHGHPDLILLDMNLPGATGQEVATRLKASPALATIPIVFLTSISDPNDIVRGLSTGAQDYLVKPVDGEVLVAHVRATLRDTRNERALGFLVRRLFTMVTLVAARLGGLLDPEALLGQVAQLIQESFGYLCVRIWLVEGGQLNRKAISGAVDDQILQAESVHSMNEECLVVECFVQDVPTHAEKVESGEDMSPEGGPQQGLSVQAVPLHMEGQAYGVLEIFSARRSPVGSNDQLIHQALADLVSVAAHDARLYRDMEIMAHLDFLTGILNRRAIIEMLETEWARSTRHHHALAVCVVDIDYFKQVNDAFGHDKGDEVLLEVARRLQDGLRREDRVGRLGGDEFLVVFPETSAEEARLVSERLRGLITDLRFGGDGDESFGVTLSMGVASSPEGEAADAGELLRAGDEFLYQAKRAGRDRVSFSGPEPVREDRGSRIE